MLSKALALSPAKIILQANVDNLVEGKVWKNELVFSAKSLKSLNDNWLGEYSQSPDREGIRCSSPWLMVLPSFQSERHHYRTNSGCLISLTYLCSWGNVHFHLHSSTPLLHKSDLMQLNQSTWVGHKAKSNLAVLPATYFVCSNSASLV